MLVRIRIPGGVIQASQLKTVAEASRMFADQEIEITSRANLQLRAIQQQDVEGLIHALADADLLPSRQHDRVRNIVASPLAGIDAEELIDVSALVRQLDEHLQMEPRYAELHPKFSFGLHGGGKKFSQDQEDLSLEAVETPVGPRFQLFIAGQDLGFTVSTEESVSCLLQLAEACINLSMDNAVPARAKNILALPHGGNQLLSGVEHMLRPSTEQLAQPVFAEAPLGIQPTAHTGYVTIAPTVPLGRLSADQAELLAAITTEHHGGLRLAPWRGVVLCGIPENEAIGIVDRLEAAGLSCSGRDGFRGIAACAGSAGCDASFADVRAHATLLAEGLAGSDAAKGWTVNLSGCEKQCARRHGATAEMIASESGYTLKIEGALAASSCSPEFALAAIVALHQKFRTEVAQG
ncbi:Cobalamin biosynthesis protein CobG [Acidisarcina polymorpha]|uniref:Cobalamin biosynthesis protein CobG n=1 Tax=Acidisarcina polymorpha TaxID=2211140 RepID=A0A2Z5G5T1_9BACT|nr:precorrin-3B synthase [Acidisarcina polymorpha]AXC14309.1 Cobalamin biosynthesis protein CobG [Acidisarcina polymorpha]